MTRREFAALSLTPLLANSAPPPVRLGIDIFSLRSQNWTAFQYLDYCAKQRVQVVHFSEIRFIGNLEPAHLREVRSHADSLGLSLEIGMKSICPSSKMFDPTQGTAEEQLTRMIDSATIVGSPIVRCVLGSADDRKPGPLSAHMDDMAAVLRNIRGKAMDHRVKIAIENHAGDMQSWELKKLVEASGPDFVGVCLDSGNPLWTLESPHVALDNLHPYVLTSHVRDSAVWKTPQGAVAVSWVVTGQGNVDIASYLRKYVQLCPGKAVSMETILFGPREFAVQDPAFWEAYREVPAWDYERFLELANAGRPYEKQAWETGDEAARQRTALEQSLAATRTILGLPSA